MMRRQRWRTILRVVVLWIVDGLALIAMTRIVPGVEIRDFRAALAASALLATLNALLWPIFTIVALPIGVLTLGLGALVLNGAVVTLAGRLLPGFDVAGVWSGIGIVIGITLINTLTTTLLGIDDDDLYYQSVVRRLARRRGGIASDIPGVVFLEIDGLAHEILVHAIRNGEVPYIARLLSRGSHKLLRWETDWSSQTGACQAGLLHGSNVDMPAFRWWEKETAKPVVTNHPRDAMEIERRHSNGRGLLAFDGASRANILSGDAPHSLLTMSTLLRRDRPGRLGQDYFTYFANPYNVTRTLLLSIADVATELWYAAQQRRRGVEPRVERDIPYALVRAWATVIQRDLQIAAVISDMLSGHPVVYSTFLGYDEVAHHSGIERLDTLHVLRRIDRQIERLVTAADKAPRPYQFVVLSDHGQSQGATFQQRTGRTLEEVVRLATRASSVEAERQGTDGLSYMSGSLTEVQAGQGAIPRLLRRMTKRFTVDGQVELGRSAGFGRSRRGETGVNDVPELVVMASGSLGLVYFARRPGRLMLEEIENLYPDVVPALLDHPAIGFLMLRSSSFGAVALGRHGTNYLDLGRIEGQDPLASFGPNAVWHLKRSDGFQHVADIMVNAAYDKETTEISAFEELVGSHGGMGGPQSLPFVLYPVSWSVPHDPVVGAEAMHTCLRSWLADLGHEAYRQPDR